MLANAYVASNSGSLNEAEGILKSAAALYPTAVEAWMSLAEVQQDLNEWDAAYSTWDSLYKLAQESSVRELAQSSLQRANDERVISKLVQGEQAAQMQDYAMALRLFLDAASLKPSSRTFDRVHNRYYEVLGRWFSKEISSARVLYGWKSIAVANFVGGSEIEGYSIRDRICSTLSTIGMESPKMIFLSEDGITALQKSSLHQLPEQDKKEIDKMGVDGVVFGTLKGQLHGYFFDVTTKQTKPLLVVQPLSSIPGFPSNIEAWKRLPSKNVTSRGLRVEVWTEQARYTVNDELTFHVRCNKDCYITLIDLQTSGGLYVILPNAFQKENYIPANERCSIPGPNATFSINATGPTGVEGIKAIATTKPLALHKPTGNEVFMVARTTELQIELCNHIRSTLRSLNDNEWDVAEWTFQILRQ